MSSLFNTMAYIQFSLANHSGLKKQLENKIEQAVENIGEELHPFFQQEDTIIDSSTFAFSYDGEVTNFPTQLLDVSSFLEILNPTTLAEELTEEQRQEVFAELPFKSETDLKYLFEVKGLNGLTPLETFERQLKKGYYTSFRQREDAINEKLSEQRLKDIYLDLLNSIKEKREEQKPAPSKFFFKDDEDSLESFQNLQERVDPSDNSQATESQEEQNQNYFDDHPNQVFYRYDYSKLKIQEELLAIGEEKGEKKVTTFKNVVTVKPRNSEWVENFRRQEYQRYANPTKPWIYVCEDGRKVTVAPVAKKISVLSGKPRFHAMLKNERPACVTILTLARDAAARLPNGVGTRADICELVKESQYITEDLPDQKLSSTISGALDRLHYMTDACVKYDSEKKLWIYLHVDRNQEYPGWGEDGEEYMQKLEKENHMKFLKRIGYA